jgi:hypothetical protein
LKDFNSATGLRVSLRLEVTTSSPSSWLLKTLARRTEESASGSSPDWPTPLESDDHAKVRKRGNPNLPATVMWPSPRATDGAKGGPNQRGSKGDLMLPSAVRRWPTPCVPNGGRQPKGGSMTITGQTPDGKKRQVDLNFAVRQWPTPRASANENRTTRNAPSHGNGHGKTLAGEVMEWPTPTAHGNSNRKGATAKSGDGLRTAAVWATPNTVDARGGNRISPSETKTQAQLVHQVKTDGLHDQANSSTTGKNRASSLIGELISRFRYSMRIQEVGEVLMEWRVRLVARLNPRWVCQLMGFTACWLDDVEWPPLKPSATRSSRKSPRS